MPSWLALCASQGAPAQSPMAYRPFTLVWQWLSMVMWPRSMFTPSASRPMPSVLAVMPTARCTSASRVSALPPASMATCTPLPVLGHLGDLAADAELHAALLERLLGGLGDLLVLDRHDPVDGLDHRHLGAQGAVEAAELDADGARADDHERAWASSSGPGPRDRPRSCRRRLPAPICGMALARAPTASITPWPRPCATRRPSGRRPPSERRALLELGRRPRSPRSCSSSSGR
jgi:hypothetical protein